MKKLEISLFNLPNRDELLELPSILSRRIEKLNSNIEYPYPKKQHMENI
jgi:hypothetical protein